MTTDAFPTSPVREARLKMRQGQWTGPTKHTLPGYVKCNLVVLPRSDAYDFLVYCQRNPKPCPLIEVTDPGDPKPRISAPGADLRTDLPRYAIYRSGVRQEDVTDICHLWRDDSVAFLIGSGMTFDDALERAGVPKTTTWALTTTIPTVSAGRFAGPMVVTMRCMTPAQAVIACQLTGRFPFHHGAPIHMGDPAAIGVDLEHPLFGEPVTEFPQGVVPVFWACGVTPQQAAIHSKVELMIAHAPGHAFVTDLLADRVCLP
ncbi:MAG: DUF1445 domain-containing protein [candidate division NC10 bacterium]|nr:DUF1445 domain-containing protein [candidate division NC10 bacterium]